MFICWLTAHYCFSPHTPHSDAADRTPGLESLCTAFQFLPSKMENKQYYDDYKCSQGWGLGGCNSQSTRPKCKLPTAATGRCLAVVGTPAQGLRLAARSRGKRGGTSSLRSVKDIPVKQVGEFHFGGGGWLPASGYWPVVTGGGLVGEDELECTIGHQNGGKQLEINVRKANPYGYNPKMQGKPGST